MNLINDRMTTTPPPGYEFYWAQGQGSLVVFKDDDVLSVIPLDKNTEGEVLKRADSIMEQLKISGT